MAVSFEQLNTGDFATDQDIDAVKKQVKSLSSSIASLSSSVGTLSSLTTAQKNNLVAAINELVGRLDTQDTYITDFDQRLENEENQVDFITGTIIGDRDNLETMDKSSIVSAINEVNGKIVKGDYTIPKPSDYDVQSITITTGIDMRNAYISIDCMEKTQTDVPQFLITGRTQTGFSFNFLPGGTSRAYPCTWIAVF